MKELNTADVLFSVLNALNGYILFGIQLFMYGKLGSILIPEEHLRYYSVKSLLQIQIKYYLKY